jgi:hypothetical protein
MPFLPQPSLFPGLGLAPQMTPIMVEAGYLKNTYAGFLKMKFIPKYNYKHGLTAFGFASVVNFKFHLFCVVINVAVKLTTELDFKITLLTN